MFRRPPRSTLFPYTTSSDLPVVLVVNKIDHDKHEDLDADFARLNFQTSVPISAAHGRGISDLLSTIDRLLPSSPIEKDRKSTRLNSSHANISYAVFCLKKKK